MSEKQERKGFQAKQKIRLDNGKKMRYIIAVYQKCIDEESNFSAERQSEPVMVRDRCE